MISWFLCYFVNFFTMLFIQYFLMIMIKQNNVNFVLKWLYCLDKGLLPHHLMCGMEMI